MTRLGAGSGLEMALALFAPSPRPLAKVWAMLSSTKQKLAMHIVKPSPMDIAKYFLATFFSFFENLPLVHPIRP
jgi:hypothetical protein